MQLLNSYIYHNVSILGCNLKLDSGWLCTCDDHVYQLLMELIYSLSIYETTRVSVLVTPTPIAVYNYCTGLTF